MNEKVSSLISEISLDSASFAGTGATVNPTFINFLFGSNGTGKSTIAKTIKDREGITLRDGKTLDDVDILVYDSEFIEDNVHCYQGMRGVYTLNKENAEIQQQIDEREARKKEIESAIAESTANRKDHVDRSEQLTRDYQEACWSRKKEYEGRYESAFRGKGRKQPLADAVLAANPEQANLSFLDDLYSSVFSADARIFDLFNKPPDSETFDNLPGIELLSTPIVNSADTNLARFFAKVGSTDWARTGHDNFTHVAEGCCPYCSRELPPDFEEQFIASFDQAYQTHLNQLGSLLQQYRNTANELVRPLKRIPDPVLPRISTQAYLDKVQLLDATIRTNIEKIQSKIDNPSSVVILDDTSSLLSDMAGMINGFNEAISANNKAVQEKAAKQVECSNAVISHIAFELSNETDAYKRDLKFAKAAIADIDKSVGDMLAKTRTIDAELRDLRKKTVETETAKDSINTMLRDSGMQGFHLVSKPDAPNTYEVRRPDGSLADNLSEGEHNFIAFLYFYHLANGTDKADGSMKDKIVVIDDPVSSMDSKALFIVSALTRQMIEVCRNAADNGSPTATGKHIKQIFILTHNAYFHREVTYSYVEKYRYVSFFLVRKADERSSIKPCEEIDPHQPSEMMNVNPVKNSYAALWEEYRELNSPIPLMNVIRRILEYYFLQLCGYEGANLRKVVLEDGKQQGRFDDKDEQFQLAAAMLSYINADTIGVNDGFDYIEGGMTADDCKTVFQMIFECMDQNQHYKMMMRER